jgi:DNA-binding transcriptional regulator YiaG
MSNDEKTARHNTEGRAKLVEFLGDEKERTQGWLATRLSVQQPSVCAWLAGTSRPSAELREAIEIVAGIPAESWMTAREREVITNAKRSRMNDDATANEHKAAS